jgi:2-alkyl-3-oxoalkanoate reductase
VKTLVTGAGGFLGGVLVERLLLQGESDLRVLLRPGSSRGRIEALRRQRPPAEVEVVTGTLTNRDDCARALEGVRLVYHLAAGTSGAAADLFLHTVVGSRNLLDAALVLRPVPKVVLVSSFAVYGIADLGRGALVDEDVPVEPRPLERDLYSQSKLRQEKLFWDYQRDHGFPLVVVRPGVIYGPGGTAISPRVGLKLFGAFLHLGGGNRLPLSYVENCADAIIVAGRHPDAVGRAFNLVDDDLPTCKAYLDRYRREVAPLRAVRLPYFAIFSLSVAVERYHRWSRGQLPAIFTPYKTRTLWGGNRFANERIKSIGWRQGVPTDEGIRRTFAALGETGRPEPPPSP